MLSLSTTTNSSQSRRAFSCSCLLLQVQLRVSHPHPLPHHQLLPVLLHQGAVSGVGPSLPLPLVFNILCSARASSCFLSPPPGPASCLSPPPPPHHQLVPALLLPGAVSGVGPSLPLPLVINILCSGGAVVWISLSLSTIFSSLWIFLFISDLTWRRESPSAPPPYISVSV